VRGSEAGPFSAALGHFRLSAQYEVVKPGRFQPSTQREVQIAGLLTNQSQYS